MRELSLTWIRSGLLSTQKILWFSFVLVCSSFPLMGAETGLNISVLYADISPAHSRLFKTIIKGMEMDGKVHISQRSYTSENSPDELKQWIGEQQADAVVFLGKIRQTFIQQLDMSIPLITGAHILADKNQPSVSLAADPELLFRKLKQLSPKVQRVFVIHSGRNTGWIIQQALEISRQQGLELEHVAIESSAEIASALRNMLQQIQPGKDAIWLVLDPLIPTRSILPKLLEVAWKKKLVIFGNNPLDVKKGILFAMYPDYTNMGKQLMTLVRQNILNTDKAQPEACRYLKLAVNNRTAAHLGITFDESIRQQITMQYPKR